jgi:hypothetical protein
MDAAGADVGGISISGHAYRCGDPPPAAPLVAAAGGAPPASAEPTLTPEQRLQRLEDLLKKGLITQDERDRRRVEIVQSL